MSEETLIEIFDPIRYYQAVSERVVRWSAGFFQCNPSFWFPGLNMDWLPLLMAWNIDLKINKIRALVDSRIEGAFYTFRALIENEEVSISLAKEDVVCLAGYFFPSSHHAEVSQNPYYQDMRYSLNPTSKGTEYVIEYLVRRFLTTAAATWSGPKAVNLKMYSGSEKTNSIEFGGKGLLVIDANISGRSVEIYIKVGTAIMSVFDDLWRKQIISSSKIPPGSYEVSVEFAQLAVTPNVLAEYTKVGTAVDLELPATSEVQLCLSSPNDPPWLRVKALNVGGYLAFETLNAPVERKALPQGMARLNFEFPKFILDEREMIQLAQPGSIHVTETQLNSPMLLDMVVNGHKIADAMVGVYQGRFAIQVQ